MNKLATTAIVTILCILLICVTTLVALGKDVTLIVGFATLTIIPFLTAAFTNKATEEVKVEATQAKEAAEQAVHNTNGRMTQMLERIAELTQTVQVLTAKEPTDSEIIEVAQHLKV